MSKKNHNTSCKKIQYHHLNLAQRAKIDALSKEIKANGKRKYSNTYIANKIGVHKSTVSRELRNRIKSKIIIRSGKIKNLPYDCLTAQQDYEYKRSLSKAEYILNKYPKMKSFIENKMLIDKWTPDVIVGYMEKNETYLLDGFTSISVPTIYNAIHYGILKVKKEDTRRMMKFKNKKKDESKEKKALSELKQPFSIDLRPENINNRNEFGHFELDTVLGKKNGIHECLMTLTERKTKFEFIFKLRSKSQDEVYKKFIQLKAYLRSNLKKLIKSITTDNGTEFSRFLEIIDKTKIDFYFCHPYCSGEKGTNEKTNSMIRYFIPKKTPIENYSNKDINDIANWLNNYPRKSLNYQTPLEALIEQIQDKTIINKILNIQNWINS